MSEASPLPPHDDLSGFVLGTLSQDERAVFLAHLETCPTCGHEVEQLRGSVRLLSLAPPGVNPPAGLESRVMAAIRKEPLPLRERRRAAESGRTRIRWPRVWRGAWAGAALAAFLLVGVGLGVAGQTLITSRAPAIPNPPTQVIQLVAAGGGPARATARIQPTASGQTIELTVTGLAPAPPDHVYVCWLVANDDTLQHQDRVAVGSFAVTSAGRAVVRWETAADLARYPHLGVTLEPANGNPLHQGPKVLTAA